MNVSKRSIIVWGLMLFGGLWSLAQEKDSPGAVPSANAAPVVAGAPEGDRAATNAPAAVGAATRAEAAVSPPGAAPPAAGQPSDRSIRFQFDGVPYPEVVTRFAQMANKPLISDTKIEGTLTFNDPQPYNYAEALDTLNLVLSMKGVMLIESDRYLRLVPLKDLPQMPIRIFHGLDRTGDAQPGEVVTVVLSLKNLNSAEISPSVSAMLSNAGSIAPLSRGRGLIVTDRLANIKRIRDLLAEVDTSSPVERQMKSYTLLHASGAVLMDLINKTFGVATAPRRVEFNQQSKQYQQLPADPNDYVTAVFDEASHTMVLFGPADRVAMAESLIQRFEDKTGAQAGEVRIFFPQATPAQDLARMIRQAIPGVADEKDTAAAAATKARLIVDSASNRLIVTAPVTAQLEEIEKLIKKIDVPVTAGTEANRFQEVQTTRILRCRTADPDSMVRILNDALARPGSRARGELPFRVTLDPKTKSMVLTGTPGDVAKAMDIVKQLDAEEPVRRSIRILPVKSGRAIELGARVQQLYADQSKNLGDAKSPDALILPDAVGSRLIVTGTAAQLQLVEDLVNQLDISADLSTRQVKAIALKYTSASSIAAMIGQLFGRQFRMEDPLQRVAATASNDDKTLMLEATAAMLAKIESVIQTLDVAPDQGAFEVRTYHLTEANANELTQNLVRLFAARPDARGRVAGVEIQPRFEADATSNTLLVAATKEQFLVIEQLIKELHASAEVAMEMRTFKLQFCEPDQMVQLLDTMLRDPGAGVANRRYRGVSYGNYGPAIDTGKLRIATAPALNAVIVQGPPEKLRLAEQLISTLDKSQTEQSSTIQTVHLKKARAESIAEGVNRVLASRGARTPSRKANITAISASNSLLIDGPAAEVEEVMKIIQELDRESSGGDIEFHIYRLENGNVQEVSRILGRLLDSLTRSLSQFGQASARVPVTVAVDTRSNSLIISATPQAFKTIEKLVTSLDQAPQRADRIMTVFTLANADAYELATKLQAMYGDRSREDQVVAEADYYSGSLTVVAKRKDMPEVEELVRRLDAAAVDTSLQVRMIALDKVPAAQMATMLRNVYAQMYAGEVKVVDKLPARPKDAVLPRATQISPGTTNAVPAVAPASTETHKVAETTNDFPEVAIAIDKAANALLVSGPAHELDRIQTIVRDLSRTVASNDTELRLFPLQEADPTAVARTLNELFRQDQTGFNPNAFQNPSTRANLRRQAATGQIPFLIPPSRIVVAAEPRTRSIIIRAQPADFILVESLIKQLDVAGVSLAANMRIYPLQAADATTLQRVIATLFSGPNSGRIRPEDRPNVAVDERMNALIVSGNESSFGIITNLIEHLDKEGVAVSGQIRIVPLKYATAQSLSAALATLFNQRYQNARSPEVQRKRPVIIADPRSNSLLVAASADDNRALDDLLDKLDRKPENNAVSLTVFGMRHNDAARVAPMLSGIFDAHRRSTTPAGQPVAPQDQVFVQADPVNNALIVSASTENLELMKGLLEKLDVEPVAMEGLIQTFTLKQADAQRAATMLRSLVDQGVYRPGAVAGGGRRSGRDAIAVTVDARSNTLIVSASPENILVVKELIKQIDSQDYAKDGSIQMFSLKHARASQVATVLEQFFRAKRASEAAGGSLERSVPVTVTPDDRTNTLLVTGGKETFEAIERMIAQLDAAEIAAKTSFKVIALRQATAAKLQATLTQLFLRRTPTMRGEAPDPITVVADSWANALIVGASPEDLIMVESLVAQLDNDQTAPGVEVQVLMLAKADVRRVAQTVTALYRTGGPGSASPVTVNVDERLNALVISAGQADIKRIAELVKKLDTDQLAQVAEIRVFPLRYARAVPLAAILTSLLNAKPTPLTDQSPSRQSLLQFIARSEEGKELLASALKEAVQITPDPRTNALLISAPADYMQLLQLLITRLDTSSPQVAQIKVFNLKNADARQMMNVLTSLFRLQRTGSQAANDRSIQYTLVRPADADGSSSGSKSDANDGGLIGTAEENALNVTVDLRTNSLLLGGTEHYVTLASQIIETLDASPAQERRSEVYRLKNSRSWEIEAALKNFLKRDTQLIAAVAGTQAMAQELLDREVGIVAETNSNTLLISATPRYFDQVKAIIEQLDLPQMQVLIQVLLAEVTLDNGRDLGVEWTYQSGGNPSTKTSSDLGVANDLQTFGGFATAVSGDHFNVLMRALESEGRLQVLSRPQILTADNQEAMIDVGQAVPVVTDSRVTQYGDSINSFAYKDVGVSLKVTPRISPDGFVKMDVAPKVSQLSSSTVQVSKGFTVPIINQRSATTTVSVQSGQSILIGGLISSTDDARTKRFPFLGRIPVLGALFRSSKKTETRVELLVMLTPQVLVKSPDAGTTRDAKAVTREQLDKSSIQREFKGDNLQQQMLEPLYPNLKTNVTNSGSSGKKTDDKTGKKP